MLNIDVLHGKRVTVMGLGLHGGGLAVATWLLRYGAEVTVTDLKTRAQLRPSVVALERAHRQGRGSLHLVLGQHRARDFRSADLVIQNPGVPRESPYLKVAQRAGVPIENEASLFLKIVRAGEQQGSRAAGQQDIRIIGVTGTRGKSTTAALIHAMLKAAGRHAVLAGNIRIPMFAVLDEVLQASKRGPVDVVLELSSWHCEHLSVRTGSVDVSVFTNILRDHLNRYRSMRAYTAAKARLLRFQDTRAVAVCNAGDPIVRAIARSFGRAVRWFAGEHPSARRWVGAYEHKGMLWYRDADGDHRIAPASSLHISGDHNIANACAAITAARALGVPTAAIRRALESFRGLPGRFETIARIGGVTYINDTCATSPDGAIAALRALQSNAECRMQNAECRIVLIAGGTDKKLEFSAWAKEVIGSVQALVLLPGTATTAMERALARADAPASLRAHDARSMAEAVRIVRRLARPGDVVLLSPGAASFGLFQHEFDRGDQFLREVKRYTSKE